MLWFYIRYWRKFFFFRPKDPKKVADKMVKKIMISSVKFFNDPDIRKLINYSKIDQKEKDRILNEIVLSGLGLAILSVETMSKTGSGERQSHSKLIAEEITDYYPNYLAKWGTKEEHVEMWRKLIEMRCKEYRKDFNKHKQELPSVRDSNPWTPIAATGGAFHILRGEFGPKNDFFKHFSPWMKMLEGKILDVIIDSI